MTRTSTPRLCASRIVTIVDFSVQVYISIHTRLFAFFISAFIRSSARISGSVKKSVSRKAQDEIDKERSVVSRAWWSKYSELHAVRNRRERSAIFQRFLCMMFTTRGEFLLHMVCMEFFYSIKVSTLLITIARKSIDQSIDLSDFRHISSLKVTV